MALTEQVTRGLGSTKRSMQASSMGRLTSGGKVTLTWACFGMRVSAVKMKLYSVRAEVVVSTAMTRVS